jgi:hypothetical protein
VYYDSLVDGRLTGGRLDVGPDHPLVKPPGQAVTRQPAGADPWLVHSIVDNGPADNRVDLVVLGDGYTDGELDLYALQVEALLAAFFQEPPLDAYASYFNVHRVDVISAESGVDEPALNLFKDTALDMSFDCAGIPQLLCVNISKANQAAALAPDADQVVVLANATRYGGAGYAAADVLTVSGGYPGAANIALHEFGHSFGNLADEYFPANGSSYGGPEVVEANATIFPAEDIQALQTKWAAWLDHPAVGAFEGCRLVHHGVNRPTMTSKMRSLPQPFGPVNGERLILQIYSSVNPIDGWSPSGSLLDCATAAGAVLTVDPLNPLTHDLQVQWLLDGSPLAGVKSPVLSLAELALPPGTHHIQARIVDATAQVRDEAARATLMTAQLDWWADCPAAPSCSEVKALWADDGEEN